MINKIFLNRNINKNITFTNKSTTSINEDPLYYQSSEYIDDEINKARIGATVIGIGVGVASKFLGKERPADKGMWAGMHSFTALGILAVIKEMARNKKANQRFENEFQYENKLDKFIGSFSIPKSLEYFDEDYQKEQYNKNKKELINTNKYIILPALIVGAVATGITAIICFAKKVPDKLDKISIVPCFTMLPTMLIGAGVLKNKNKTRSK